ncbi:MAG: tryptophan--tRNA ligase [Pseudomonadota bacterium]
MSKHTQRVLSGVQPTGNLHLGNYLGAIKQWVAMQDSHESLFCIVDLHAITVPQDPQALRENTREVAAAYIAAGIDPEKSAIFQQSGVRAHAELSWILGCMARIGWLNRMTQFKDKAGKDKEKASVGLYVYPVLMAADILAYKATHVPVGEDQKQHLELARDIATKFNNDMGAEDFFPLPEPMIQGPATRVMSLRDGTAKMSKSDPSDLSRITFTDDADAIAKKFKKAKSDPDPLPSEEAGLEGRPEARNLVGIYAALAESTASEVLSEFGGQGFGALKPRLAELAVEKLAPISAEMRKLMADPEHLDGILTAGVARADAIAAPILAETKEIMGFLAPKST